MTDGTFVALQSIGAVARLSSSARSGTAQAEPPVYQSIHIRSLQAGFCGQEPSPVHLVGWRQNGDGRRPLWNSRSMPGGEIETAHRRP